MLLIGGLAGLLASVMTFVWVYRILPQEFLRWMQVADGIGIAGFLVWGLVINASNAEHDAPRYDGYKAILDIEVRAPKAVLYKAMDAMFFISIGAGLAQDTKHGELIREDGGYRILPVELQVSRLHEWAIRLDQVSESNTVTRYWFQLNLPESPKGNIPWSEWSSPVPKETYSESDDITIRYRWVLIPSGQPRVYEP